MAPKKKAKTSHTRTGSGLSLKLLVDQKSNRVIFAEGGKDVIDFLFSLLQMPVGSIVRLLTTKNMAGSIGNIFKSVEDLDDGHIQSDQNKDMLLKPCISSVPLPFRAGLLTHGDNSPAPEIKKIYRCPNCNYYCAQRWGTPCVSCKSLMIVEMECVYPNAADKNKAEEELQDTKGGGFVKEMLTFMLMDDLTITPMSTISGLALLNKFGVKNTGSIEEQRVFMGMEEGLALLKASLQSKTVLTDVFLRKKKANNQ